MNLQFQLQLSPVQSVNRVQADRARWQNREPRIPELPTSSVSSVPTPSIPAPLAHAPELPLLNSCQKDGIGRDAHQRHHQLRYQPRLSIPAPLHGTAARHDRSDPQSGIRRIPAIEKERFRE
jgi:hypothetical protein